MKVENFLIIIIVLCVIFFGVTVYQHGGRYQKADTVAESMGCVNLGSARDMNSVFFFDCDGKIELRRVK